MSGSSLRFSPARAPAITLPPGDDARRNVAVFGEHPLVVVNDIASRPRPNGHVIVVANEKGGVGKSTLAFHCCIGLADAGNKVAAIDLDPRQQTLARALTFREATARRLEIDLPCPSHAVPQQMTGAQLHQEIARIGSGADYVVIDVAGHDSPIARRAIAMADTLITPINSSFVDMDLLGRFHPTTTQLLGPGYFSVLVGELRQERLRRGLSGPDWLVMQNRARRGMKSRNQSRIDEALEMLAPTVGFRLCTGLAERVAYRELFLLGLTHLDLRHIPALAHMRANAKDEIMGLLADLRLPARTGASAKTPASKADPVTSEPLQAALA